MSSFKKITEFLISIANSEKGKTVGREERGRSDIETVCYA